MIGDKFKAFGIILKYGGADNWSASIKFFDAGYDEDRTVQGTLTTRYFVHDIAIAIDVIREDAERLGIEVDSVLLGYRDGESKDWPMPKDWKDVLKKQAKRIGGTIPY